MIHALSCPPKASPPLEPSLPRPVRHAMTSNSDDVIVKSIALVSETRELRAVLWHLRHEMALLRAESTLARADSEHNRHELRRLRSLRETTPS